MGIFTKKLPQAFDFIAVRTGIAGLSAPFRLLLPIILLTHFWIIPKSVSAQDPFFTQFQLLPMNLNPALTGNEGKSEITLIFRDQWPEFPQTYVNYAMAWSQFFPEANSGFGVMAMGDRQGNGLINTHSARAFYVFGVQLKRNMAIRAGFEGGYYNRRLDWLGLRFFDQIDPVFGLNDPSGVPNPTTEVPPGETNVSWFDLGFGAMLFGKKWYAGASAGHLNRPDVAFYSGNTDRIPVRWGAQAGLDLTGGPKRNPYHFRPYALYLLQGRFQQIQIGAHGQVGVMSAGIGFRHAVMNADAVLLSLGFQKGVFGLGYSYDLSVGSVGFESGGAHEIALRFRLNSDSDKDNRRDMSDKLRCPLL